jgi:hypothetical protein
VRGSDLLERKMIGGVSGLGNGSKNGLHAGVFGAVGRSWLHGFPSVVELSVLFPMP